MANFQIGNRPIAKRNALCTDRLWPTVFFQTINRKEAVMLTREWLRAVVVVMFTLAPMSVSAEVPWQFADNTRYMAMGDSLASGYGAVRTP